MIKTIHGLAVCVSPRYIFVSRLGFIILELIKKRQAFPITARYSPEILKPSVVAKFLYLLSSLALES